MSDFIKEKLKDIGKEELIIDVGGGSPCQKWLSEHKDELCGEYKCLDIDASKTPDIVGDAHNLPFKDGEVDAIICWSVLEHLENPFKAVSEIYRSLKKGGKLLAFVPFIYPYHGVGDCPDYWRFTREGVEFMLKDFSLLEIKKARGYFDTFTPFLPKAASKILSPFARKMDGFGVGKSTSAGFEIYAEK